MTGALQSVDPELLEAWLRARSVARGLPQPVKESDYLRVETGADTELRRYFFARPTPALGLLAQSIHDSRIFLKLCGSQPEMTTLLPAGWELLPLAL